MPHNHPPTAPNTAPAPAAKKKPQSLRVPKYRLNKPSGRAVVTLNGVDHWLGKYGTAESRQKYDRLIQEWLKNGRQGVADRKAAADLSINELMLRFWRAAEVSYRDADGNPSGELRNLRVALKPLVSLFGFTQARDFGPADLKTVRQWMISKGWTRRNINRHLNRVKSVFKWAVSESLLPGSQQYTELQAVKGLRRGECGVKEKPKVKPVPAEYIDTTRAFLSPTLAAMLDVQLLTGCRPAEVRNMRGIDIDTSDPKLWVYRPYRHKTEHKDIERVIYIGPKAQEVIGPFLADRPVDAFLFSPRDTLARRYAQAKTHRRKNQKPNARKSARVVGARYNKDSHVKAFHDACDKANRWAKGGMVIGSDERVIPRWGPNRLRHCAATALRKTYGRDVAQVVLGHTTGATTEIYAQSNIDAAKAAILAVG